jgi:hypothetical protein
MDITQAIAPKSDQLDFADLDGSPPQVFTITEVSENKTELAEQQPVNIRLAEFPRWWRPSKGMLRVMSDNWGRETGVWVGRQVELYGDPNVYFGKEKRGGKGAFWKVDPLPVAPAANPNEDRIADLTAEWHGATPERKEAIVAEVAELRGQA